MRYILCCDYGLNNALATVDILVHARRTGDLVDIVAVGGHVPAAQSLLNAKQLVSALGIFPNLIVDTTALRQPEFLLAEPFRDMGGGNIPTPVVNLASYPEYLDFAGGEYALLSLAPHTVASHILGHGTCTRLVLFGGTLREPPEYHGYEFNQALNRRAFAEVVKRPHVAVTLDTCKPFSDIFFEVTYTGSKEHDLYYRIADKMQALRMDDIMREEGGYVEQFPRSIIAAKYLLHPEWFELDRETDQDGNLLTVARYIGGKPFGEILEE